MQQIEIINQTDFENFCQTAITESAIAIDTEFMRDRYYYPKLCLLQLATPDCIALVDPFTVKSYQPLVQLFNAKSLLKIFHSAQQDLEVLELETGTVPKPLFDTQIAATFLGSKNQVSYADLVYQLLNVRIDKSHTRTDWARRPLSKQQLDYAANDVKYLHEIHQLQNNKLQQLGRQTWLDDEIQAFTETTLLQPKPEELWKKVKGSQSLKGKQLNILKELAIWRELLAKNKNLPKRFILKDDVMIDLARLKPKATIELDKLRQFPKALPEREQTSLIEAIDKALSQEKSEWPQTRDYVRLSKSQEAIADCAMSIIRWSAASNDLSSELIANRKDIEAALTGKNPPRFMRGWRYNLAGQFVQAFLQGKLQIEVINDELTFTMLSD